MRANLNLLAGVVFACVSVVGTAQTTTPQQPEQKPPQQQTDEPGMQQPPSSQQPTQQQPDEPPTQPQAQPTQPQTPSDQAQQPNAQAQAGQLTKATAADLKAGTSVYDTSGQLVGKIESADAEGGVVNTGAVKAKLALSSFGKNDKGLVISMTKSELEAAAKAKNPK